MVSNWKELTEAAVAQGYPWATDAALTPQDWSSLPERTEGVRDWRVYIPERVRALWPGLHRETRIALILVAAEMAGL